MRIGTLDLACTSDGYSAVLAPMASITNPPFRALCLEQGCPLAITEMVSSEALVRGVGALRMERAPGERVLAVQLFGADPAVMAEAARRAEAAGADLLDINMGCPAHKIADRSGSGAALMREPERAVAIAAAMVRAVRVPVTVKLRAGWDEGQVNALELARAMEGAGVALVTLHARTREEAHAGPVRLDLLREVKAALRIPVVGNGGVRSLADARHMHAGTGCDGVMVGRGAQGNPWLFATLARGAEVVPDVDERFGTLRRHYTHYVQWAGGDRAVREMRKHLAWYVRGLPGAARFRAQACRMERAAEVLEALAEYREALRRG